jgi:hypothetical protein
MLLLLLLLLLERLVACFPPRSYCEVLASTGSPQL